MTNKIKIIFNEEKNTLGYLVLNDKFGWIGVPTSSKLSREEFTNISIEDGAERILDYISDTYAFGTTDQVEIILEGFSDECNKFIKETKKYGKINVVTKDFNILVCGKVKSGKSTLIEALCTNTNFERNDNFTVYHQNRITWYEIDGLDIEDGSYMKVVNDVKLLTESVDISAIVYCVCFDNRRLEKAEKELLEEIKSIISDSRIIVAITNAIDEVGAKEFGQEIMTSTEGVIASPVLAKSVETKLGVIEAYGLFSLNNYIFGGLL